MYPIVSSLLDNADSDMAVCARAMAEVASQREEGLQELAQSGMVPWSDVGRMLSCLPPEELQLLIRGKLLEGEPCRSPLCPWCYGRQVIRGLEELGVLAAFRSKQEVAFFHSRLGFDGDLDNSFKRLFVESVRKAVCELYPTSRFLFRTSIQPTRDSRFARELVVGAVTSVLPNSGTGHPKSRHVHHRIVSCDHFGGEMWRSLTEGFLFPTNALFAFTGQVELLRSVEMQGRFSGLEVCDAATDSERRGTLIIPWWWNLVKDAG